MSNVLIDRQKIDILANAISDKSGVPVTMTLDEMLEAVDGIETGGGEPNLQAKTYTVDSAGTETITADSGYDGLSSVSVSVPQADPYVTMNFGYYTENNVRKWKTEPMAEVIVSEGDTAGWVANGFRKTGEGRVYSAISTGTTVAPTESSQTIGGANYMMEGAVTVSAIPSNYVGSGITQRSSSDLTASGATVTVPSGYYSAQASKAVASGTATMPSYMIGDGADIAYSKNNGNISLSKSVSGYRPIVTNEGYISTGTLGDVVMHLEADMSINESSELVVAGATVTAPKGYYPKDASVSVASGTEGTPTATKGTVSNHQVSVTPSVTNTAGYISGGTKNGTAVTVSASELVSGTYTVDSSGTKDVTNYASASVPAGAAGTPSASKGTVSNHSVSVTPSVTNTTGWITGSTKTGTAVTVSASELVSGTLSLSDNGTSDCTNYASVNVNIPFVTYYTGTSTPASSLGSNGDIYLKVVS